MKSWGDRFQSFRKCCSDQKYWSQAWTEDLTSIAEEKKRILLLSNRNPVGKEGNTKGMRHKQFSAV